MTFAGLDGPLVYVGILLAAIVEGEVAFVLAATLVGQGRLSPVGVIVAGATGAAIGDQFYFYALRGRLRRWLDRYESVARRGRSLVDAVHRHQAPTVLLIRFAPGLRIALAAACAYADVRPALFSTLNAVSSLVWAVFLMAAVAWVGPATLHRLGVSGWWGGLIPGALVLLGFRIVAGLERRALRAPALLGSPDAVAGGAATGCLHEP